MTGNLPTEMLPRLAVFFTTDLTDAIGWNGSVSSGKIRGIRGQKASSIAGKFCFTG
jgi:hypothetical protein